MTTLITGGAGLIGSKVAERLLGAGESVVLLDVAAAPERTDPLVERFGEQLTVERGDVLGVGNLGAAVRRHGVDSILHLAYLLGAESNANPGLATQVNAVGTANVLDVARLFEVRRVVLASSIAVYGRDAMYPRDALPLTEDAPPWVAPGVPIYGGGKVYMEQLGAHYRAQYGLEVVGLRPSIVYGPGRRTGATGWVVVLIEDPALGRSVSVGFGDAKMSLVYVEDVADQFTAMLQAPSEAFAQRRFFNTGGDTCTMRELADVVRGIIPDASIEVAASGETDLAGLAASVSGDALEQAVGHRRRSLEEGVREHMNAARTGVGLAPLGT
ncbi:MAG: NAD-dependent epimerase/dehydratase family protein [Pseudonocardiaceae bacterium]|nr:NAD-dependent epimerase/dehydratase family protein [Pseudonocardiaceae bacterium]